VVPLAAFPTLAIDVVLVALIILIIRTATVAPWRRLGRRVRFPVRHDPVFGKARRRARDNGRRHAITTEN
jgi:hypothetical protein